MMSCVGNGRGFILEMSLSPKIEVQAVDRVPRLENCFAASGCGSSIR